MVNNVLNNKVLVLSSVDSLTLAAGLRTTNDDVLQVCTHIVLL
jgi:hypothetical protein